MPKHNADNEHKYRCSNCKGPFIEGAKLIAECYKTICGDCNQDLMSRVDEAGNYECPLCNSTHEMPTNGLPENAFQGRFIKRQKIERPLEPNKIALKEEIRTLKTQLQKLESFDHKDHIDLYYKQIERQIIEAIENVMNGLDDMRAEAIKTVNRNQKRSFKHLERRISVDRAKLKRISEKISDFSSKWSDALDGSNYSLSVAEEAVIEGLATSKDFMSSIESLKTEMCESALRNTRVVLKSDKLRRITTHKLVKIVSQPTFQDIDPPDVERGFDLVGHTSWIGQVVFLPNGLLASCSYDRLIKIWNISQRRLLFELYGHTSSIESLLVLPMTMLASCAKDEIKIWDLKRKRAVATISLDEPCSIAALANGLVASYSKYGTLCICDPVDYTLILYKRGQYESTEFNYTPFIDCMSNGNLVTSLRDEKGGDVCEFKVRDPGSGHVLMSFNTGAKNVSSQLLLRDDRLALGTKTGSLAIIDLISGSIIKQRARAHESHVSALAELSLDRLVSCGVDNDTASINIWSLSDLTLISTKDTGIETYIETISISRDEKYAALSKSSHFKITIWPLDV